MPHELPVAPAHAAAWYLNFRRSVEKLLYDTLTHPDILSPTLITPRKRDDSHRVATIAEDRWLSVEEIAKYLGVVKASVYRWIDRKSLPAHKVGKLWKFKTYEVDEWVRSGGANDDHAGSQGRRRRR